RCNRALIRLRLGVCLPFSSRERVMGSQMPSQSCSWVRPRSSRRCLIYSPRKTFFKAVCPPLLGMILLYHVRWGGQKPIRASRVLLGQIACSELLYHTRV